jgi:hypothetical protein
MREEFLITRSGKQYVLFAGLLDEAHSQGLVAIDTDLVQVPDDSNGQVAVTKATVTIEKPDRSTGEVQQATYSGIGDASPQNVGRNIVPHLIRMSETRAKARALRDAVNVGASSLEELHDSDDSGNSGSSAGNSAGSGASSSSSTSSEQRAVGSRNQMHAVQGGQADQGGQGFQTSSPEPPPPEEGDPGYGGADVAGGRTSKAPKSQIDFIKTLAEEWRGPQGVTKLEQRIGKSLTELTRTEAESWIDKLTPDDGRDAGEASGQSQGG